MKAAGLGDDDINMFEMMVKWINGNNKRPMSLRFVDRKRLKKAKSKVNKIVMYLETLLHCNC